MDVRTTETNVLIGLLATECTQSCIPYLLHTRTHERNVPSAIEEAMMAVHVYWCWTICLFALKSRVEEQRGKKCVQQTPNRNHVWIMATKEDHADN